MKVAHIATVDMSLRYLLLAQLCSLVSEGYEVVGISSSGTHVPVIESAGIRHRVVSMTRNFTPLADLVSLWHLYRIMRQERFAIVHTHTPKPGLLGQIAARLAGVPVVVNTLHGFYFHDHMPWYWRRFYILVEWIAAKCSDVVLSQNKEDIQTALQERICPPEKIKYLGNGIDVRHFDRSKLAVTILTDKRRELRLLPGQRVIGFVGRLVVEKGIVELFRAMQVVRNQTPDVRLLVIGPIDDEKPDVLKPNMVDAYGLSETCIFTGLRQDMPELYALMDVFVLPSHREGFPRSPMEASSMSVPCVVTDIRGCREAVEHGQNGFLVPLGDVGALAAAILALLEQPDLAHRMGETGRRMAEEKFDEQIVFGKVKAEYVRLLTAKGLSVPRPNQ